MLYLQLVAFPFLAAAGIAVGVRAAKSRGWWAIVAAAFLVIGVVILGERTQRFHFVPPMSWFVSLNWNPMLMTGVISTLLTLLLLRLPQRRTRYFLGATMAAMLIFYGVLPAAMPLAARASLLSKKTVIDASGVCRQQHDFSCGPAAAVTCLGALGVQADEGSMAVAARCGPGVGTDGWALAAAMQDAAPARHFVYQYAATLDEVHTPAVADMNMQGIGGHFITILSVEREGVLVGDPLGGRDVIPRGEFLAEWEHGVVEIGP